MNMYWHYMPTEVLTVNRATEGYQFSLTSHDGPLPQYVQHYTLQCTENKCTFLLIEWRTFFAEKLKK